MGLITTQSIGEESLFPVYMAVVGSFLLGLAIILFCVYYLRRMYQQKLKVKQMESDFNRDLLESTLQAQEEERNRIASDLHDEVGAMLSAIKLHTTFLKEIQEADKREEAYGKISYLVDETIKNLRHISQNLMPANLERFGLLSAIDDLAEHLNGVEGAPRVKLQSKCEEVVLTELQQLHLYRIVQELLNNSLKHAQATEITITIEQKPKTLEMEYQDNGIGFSIPSEKEENQKSGGLGMKTISSRAQMLNAHIAFPSISKGFCLLLILEL